jgi:hypothetical protein
MIRAIFDQLAMASPQQLAGGVDDLFRANFEEPFVGLGAAGV